MEALAYDQFQDLERSHWWFRGRRTVYLGLLRHELRGERLERILDLGAGMGGFREGLAEFGEHVCASDVDLDSLKSCVARGYASSVLGSGYALPYQDASFDLVCMFDAIEHIPDDAQVMAEVQRILRPGGRVFVSVPAYQFLYANNDRVAQHQRRYTRGMLRELFEGAGLSVERNTHANIFLFPLILPTVLGIKALERLGPPQEESQRTNLSWPIPGFVHSALHGVFAAELPFSRRFDWPAGHSIAALARKPG